MNLYYHDEDADIRLYHGDCRDDLSVFDECSVLLADPPYGIDYKNNWNRDDTEKIRSIDGDEDLSARDDFLSYWGGRPGLVFGTWKQPPPDGAKAQIVWDKGDFVGMGDLKMPWKPNTEEIYVLGSGFSDPDGRREGGVLRFPSIAQKVRHPHEKPVPLLVHLLERCPAGRVADPFHGSGSTAEACLFMGRGCVASERCEGMLEMQVERLRQQSLFGPDYVRTKPVRPERRSSRTAVCSERLVE